MEYNPAKKKSDWKITRRGYNVYEMMSLLQKAIRRGDVERAAFAAYEIFDTHTKLFWNRMLIISAEDCYGIMTKEIVALKQASEIHGGSPKLFAAKAIVLLCMARKNRDADYLCVAFMNDDHTLDLSSDDLEVDMSLFEAPPLPGGRIPDYVYDCHTWKGKANGKKKSDMMRSEYDALTPYQTCLFDDEDWDNMINGLKANERNT